MPDWSYDGLTYRRRLAREVRVGDVGVGGDNPIRIQSMTTPATRDVEATVRQIARLVEAGCEIVRVTVPTTADADSLPEIRRKMKRQGLRVPLVADIHFTPAVAMKAVEHVEKIRVNPGNFADKKRFAVREYTDAEYEAELDRIAHAFSPLVLRARELGVAMRIGTNHGSLSDRIMNRYGDSPEGMVESALEFVRISEGHGYRDLVLSMKASNPVIVLQVYRLLALRMAEAGMDYPFHVGVTEAGDGTDGRIKSAIGIGALLADGLGDTIRVSLTEDPVAEIPVARALVEQVDRWRERSSATRAPAVIELRSAVRETRDPLVYRRRSSRRVVVGPHAVGGESPVLVEVSLRAPLGDESAVRLELHAEVGRDLPEESRADLVSVPLGSAEDLPGLERIRGSLALELPRLALSAEVDLRWLRDADETALRRWLEAAHRLHLVVRESIDGETRRLLCSLLATAPQTGTALLIETGSSRGDTDSAVDLALELAGLQGGEPRCLLLAMAPTEGDSPLHATRLLAARLDAAGFETPIVLLDRPLERNVEPLTECSATLGGLLCDGIGDAVQIRCGVRAESRRLAFGILQASRVRVTRAEFISCPSCGRTLFDLEETTARIKARTAHLRGVKIAVMGCVVNGPGEMADADFGYVGWGENKIALFVGKEIVAKDVPTDEADERLVELIRAHGRWVDPPPTPGGGA